MSRSPLPGDRVLRQSTPTCPRVADASPRASAHPDLRDDVSCTSEAALTREQRPALTAPVPLAGVDVHPVTRRQAVNAVVQRAVLGGGGVVVTPNVDHVVLLERDATFRAAYERAFLRLCDGMPLVLLSRMMGRPVPERVAGADLFLDLCGEAAARGLRVFIAGGMPDVLERGLVALRERFPGLDVTGHSPPLAFEGTVADRVLQRAIAAAEPDLVMICLGAPRAEVWAAGQVERHQAVYLCVGAAIDFAAGARRRAPGWVQTAGLEWLYRLVQEPRRLWRRYLVQDSAFLRIAVRELTAGRLSA